jgi:hypothetical protein
MKRVGPLCGMVRSAFCQENLTTWNALSITLSSRVSHRARFAMGQTLVELGITLIHHGAKGSIQAIR